MRTVGESVKPGCYKGTFFALKVTKRIATLNHKDINTGTRDSPTCFCTGLHRDGVTQQDSANFTAVATKTKKIVLF